MSKKPKGESKRRTAEWSGRMQLVIPWDLVCLVDEWRAQQPNLPNRSEAIRRLVEKALKSARS